MNLDELRQIQWEWSEQSIAAVVAFCVIIGMWWGIRYVRGMKRRLREWEKTMSGEQRTRYLDRLIADEINDILDKLRLEGTMSDQEARKYSVRIGKAAGLPDLLVKYLKSGKLTRKSQIDLKNTIRERVARDYKINPDDKIVQLKEKKAQKPKKANIINIRKKSA